jgi:hypothetical protein
LIITVVLIVLAIGETFFPDFDAIEHSKVLDLEQTIAGDNALLLLELVGFEASDEMAVALAQFVHKRFHL